MVSHKVLLGPLLFLIFINHVASKLKRKFNIFADNLKIYASIDRQRCTLTQDVYETLVQEDIDTL